MTVTSDKRIASNRENARKSSGPRTSEGSRAARNALRHSLAIPAVSIASLLSEIEVLARSIVPAGGRGAVGDHPRQEGSQEPFFQLVTHTSNLASGWQISNAISGELFQGVNWRYGN